MMKRIFYIFLITFGLILCKNGICQDINFSQFHELPILRNPALAVMNKNKDFEGSNFEPVNDGPSTAQIAASIAAHYETKELDRKDTDIIPFGLEDIIIQRRRRRCGDIYFVISLFVFDFCFL